MQKFFDEQKFNKIFKKLEDKKERQLQQLEKKRKAEIELGRRLYREYELRKYLRGFSFRDYVKEQNISLSCAHKCMKLFVGAGSKPAQLYGQTSVSAQL